MKTLLLSLASVALLQAGNIYATFDVMATKEASLKLQGSGIIENIYVDIGDSVKKGDLLLSLDSEMQKADIEQVKIDLAIAKVNAKYANRAKIRTEKLKGLIDEAKLDNSVQNAKMRTLQVSQIEAKLRLKEIAYKNTILKAPFSGTITQKNVEVGDGYGGIAGGSAFVLQCHLENKLVIHFDEKYWKVVKVGDRFEFTVDGESQKRIGKISKIYPTINSKNRMMSAEVLIDGVPVGLFGDGNIIIK
jgi:RND family efflux transporter MFP subunit